MVFKDYKSEYVPYFELDMGGVTFRRGFYVGEEDVRGSFTMMESEETADNKTQQNTEKNYVYYVHESETRYSLEDSLSEVIKECSEVKYLKELALLKVNLGYNKVCERELTKNVPISEVQTWAIQKQEAETYSVTKKAPFLERLATIRGMDLNLLIQKVREKNDLYLESVSSLTGIRQKLEDQIFSTEDPEVLKKIEFSLPDSTPPTVTITPNSDIQMTKQSSLVVDIMMGPNTTDYDVLLRRPDIIIFDKETKTLTTKNIKTEGDTFWGLVVLTPKNIHRKGKPSEIKVKVK